MLCRTCYFLDVKCMPHCCSPWWSDVQTPLASNELLIIVCLYKSRQPPASHSQVTPAGHLRQAAFWLEVYNNDAIVCWILTGSRILKMQTSIQRLPDFRLFAEVGLKWLSFSWSLVFCNSLFLPFFFLHIDPQQLSWQPDNSGLARWARWWLGLSSIVGWAWQLWWAC